MSLNQFYTCWEFPFEVYLHQREHLDKIQLQFNGLILHSHSAGGHLWWQMTYQVTIGNYRLLLTVLAGRKEGNGLFNDALNTYF